MNCKKCGKIVADSDLFCTHCGTVLVSFDNEKTTPAVPQQEMFAAPEKEPVKEIPAAEPVNPAPEGKGSPVIVLGGKSEPVLKAQPEKKPEPDSEFVWNVYDFPKPQSKKTEEVKFSWDTSALELTKAQAEEKKMEEELFGELDARLKAQEEPAAPAEEEISLTEAEEVPEEDLPAFGLEASPISDDLFKELFGDDALLKSLEEEAWNEEIGGEEAPASETGPLSQPAAASSPASEGAEERETPARPIFALLPEGFFEPAVFEETPQPPAADSSLASEGAVKEEENSWEKDLFAELTLPPEAEGPEKHPEKFFTFTQKNEEFQKLLDREYERMQKMSSRGIPLAPQETRRYPSRDLQGTTPQSAAPTAPAFVLSPEGYFESAVEATPQPAVPAAPLDRGASEKLQPSADNSLASESAKYSERSVEPAPAIVFKDTAPLPKIPAELRTPEAPAPQPAPVDKSQPIPEVPAVPGSPAAIGAAAAISPAAQAMTRSSGREKKAPFAPTPEEAKTIFLEVHEEKFRQSVWNEEDYDDEKPRRSAGKYIGRTILVIIIVILVLEVASLATLFFAPESKAAPLAEKFQEKTLGLVLDMKDRVTGEE
ncbi:MAG: zinc ribbon domain-containing protein [Firmicutes bacterium]|nr:zinc ribbon domain-containing protein [Bacillota bacterium]